MKQEDIENIDVKHVYEYKWLDFSDKSKLCEWLNENPTVEVVQIIHDQKTYTLFYKTTSLEYEHSKLKHVQDKFMKLIEKIVKTYEPRYGKQS